MAGESAISAWRPGVPGISEVFHAHFVRHAYPVHTHTVWTLLILDDGVLQYDLDRHEHGTLRSQVVLLPPHVPHNGRTAAPHGFRKRVLYLPEPALDERLIGPATDQPNLRDPLLWNRIGRLHDTLAAPGDELEAESRLAFVVERLGAHLNHDLSGDPAGAGRRREPDRGLADDLRDLLDARVVAGLPLDEAAHLLHADSTHLIRSFTRRFSLPPHLYLTGRRVELARRLLLDGVPAATVATEVGFYDQSHLTRHFKRMLGVSPAKFAGRR
ncbi:helix-turn-helix transcriptional regulator [Amycolatopsis rhabdoformis]|uniref:Helix-turn-helix transcriptional regulator n=1 Tax=Amycolatopsis rhabdoformis TaxID=1448059 RepID=A0ABZ1HXX7_9PSEU|nr:helix-turn-helix transcriptional regulator [Amycolatopsis rhabdoformis]WSE26228.1 helix-turn-helix transcriptional regulator [Amycolatopsis rhabdoformis]